MKTSRTYEVITAHLTRDKICINAGEVHSLDTDPDGADLYRRVPGSINIEIDDTDLRPNNIFVVTIEIVPGEVMRSAWPTSDLAGRATHPHLEQAG